SHGGNDEKRQRHERGREPLWPDGVHSEGDPDRTSSPALTNDAKQSRHRNHIATLRRTDDTPASQSASVGVLASDGPTARVCLALCPSRLSRVLQLFAERCAVKAVAGPQSGKGDTPKPHAPQFGSWRRLRPTPQPRTARVLHYRIQDSNW